MNIEDLTPEQIAVLKKVAEDGIEADLSDEEEEIRDQLEDMNLIYISGDEYDCDWFLRSEARELLLQSDPKWWIQQRTMRERKIAQTKEQIVLEPMGHKDAIERITARYEGELSRENSRHERRTAVLQQELVNSEHELQQWLEDHKSHYTEEVK